MVLVLCGLTKGIGVVDIFMEILKTNLQEHFKKT